MCETKAGACYEHCLRHSDTHTGAVGVTGMQARNSGRPKHTHNTHTHLSTEPGHLLLGVVAAVMVQVGHRIQPHHEEPVGQHIQVQHGWDAQLHSEGCHDGQPADQEVVGGHALRECVGT